MYSRALQDGFPFVVGTTFAKAVKRVPIGTVQAKGSLHHVFDALSVCRKAAKSLRRNQVNAIFDGRPDDALVFARAIIRLLSGHVSALAPKKSRRAAVPTAKVTILMNTASYTSSDDICTLIEVFW